MSNKARHSELLKRLDTLDNKLDQLLIATAKISAQHPEGPPPDNRRFQQHQALKPLSPYQQESPVTEHSAKLSAAE